MQSTEIVYGRDKREQHMWNTIIGYHGIQQVDKTYIREGIITRHTILLLKTLESIMELSEMNRF